MFSSSTKKTSHGRNNHRHGRNKRRRLPLPIGVALAVFIAVAGITWILPSALHQPLTVVAQPVWKGGAIAGAWGSGIVAQFTDKAELAAENEALERRIATLEEQVLDRAVLATQNAQLKEMLGRSDITPQSTLAAVLRRPPVVPYDTFVIDIGSADDVAQGAQVKTRGGAFIGTIESTTAHTARVQLLSAPGKRIDVVVGTNGTPATAVGRGAGNFKMEVPKDIDIQPGDAVRVPGSEPIVIGVVSRTATEPTDAFQTVTFRLPRNLFELTWVEVTTAQ